MNVPTVIVFMVLALALAAGILAVVVMGMEGHFRGRSPELADRLARTARHLNGDAEPPKRVQHLFR